MFNLFKKFIKKKTKLESHPILKESTFLPEFHKLKPHLVKLVTAKFEVGQKVLIDTYRTNWRGRWELLNFPYGEIVVATVQKIELSTKYLEDLLVDGTDTLPRDWVYEGVKSKHYLELQAIREKVKKAILEIDLVTLVPYLDWTYQLSFENSDFKRSYPISEIWLLPLKEEANLTSYQEILREIAQLEEKKLELEKLKLKIWKEHQ